MSTVPQKVIVNGELQVICTTVLGETRGAIRFVDASQNQFGQMRAWGQYPFARMIIDTVGMSNGCAFKMKSTQGSVSDGGAGEKYTLEVSSGGINTTNLTVYPATRNLFIGIRENGQSVADFGRGGTADYVPVYSYLSRFTQDQFKTNENVGLLSVGRNFGTNAVWGIITPGGADPTLDQFYLGGATSTSVTPTVSMSWNTTGNVTFPAKVTAGTISATVYENLPATSVDPLTLVPATGYVGINNPNPQCALDVKGFATFHYDNTYRVTFDYLNSDPSSPEVIFDLGGPGVGWINMSADLTVIGDLVISGTSRVEGVQLISRNDLYVGKDLILGTANTTLPPEHRVFLRQVVGVPTHTAQNGSLALREDGTENTTLYTKTPSGWKPVSTGSVPVYVEIPFTGPVYNFPSGATGDTTRTTSIGSVSLDAGSYSVQLRITQTNSSGTGFFQIAGLQSTATSKTLGVDSENDPSHGCTILTYLNQYINPITSGTSNTLIFPTLQFSLPAPKTLYLHLRNIATTSAITVNPINCVLAGTKF